MRSKMTAYSRLEEDSMFARNLHHRVGMQQNDEENEWES